MLKRIENTDIKNWKKTSKDFLNLIFFEYYTCFLNGVNSSYFKHVLKGTLGT